MPTSNFVEICAGDVNVSGIETSYYTFSFDYTFKHDSDCVFFSHCVPYSYSDLMKYLFLRQMGQSPTQGSKNKDVMLEKERISQIMSISTLCNSLAGNPVKYLTITSNINSYALKRIKLNDAHYVSEVKKMLKLRPLRNKAGIERKHTMQMRRETT